MEELTLIIMERIINQFPEIKWVDMQKQQMMEERPPLLFPAALVSVTLPKCNDLNSVNQQCQAIVEIQLCWSWTPETSSSAFNIEDRTKSLEYLQTNRKLYEKMQGWSSNTSKFSSLSRVSGGADPLLRKGYKISSTLFKTDFFDQSFEPLFLANSTGSFITGSNGLPIQMNEI